MLHNPQCWNNHLGAWCIYPEWLSRAIDAIKFGHWLPNAQQATPNFPLGLCGIDFEAKAVSGGDNIGNASYLLTADGVAVVFVDGPIMKAQSKFGGASSIATRQALRAAASDEKVNAILIHIDSPGGTVAGTQELANEIRAADAKKPVYAHIDDLGASAAYWIASQARRVTANPMAMIGSIGTFAVLKDTSEAMKLEGIKVHVVSTGPLKGAGASGTPITEEVLQEVQQLVNAQNEFFLSAVSEGRKLSMKEVKAVADGRMMMAADAKKAGLIDAVQSLDDVMGSYTERIRSKKKTRAEQERLGLALKIQEAE